MAIRRFTRTLTAVFTAVALAFAVDLSPAAAAAKPAAVKSAVVKPNVDPATIAAIIKQLYSYYQQYFGAKSMTLAQATQAIIDAINASETNIINQINGVAAAQARACANAAVINAHDIPLFTTDTLQAFANDTTSCVTLIDSLLQTLTSQDKATVDELGYALGLISPIALAARSYAGFSTTALVSTLRSASYLVVFFLPPDCQIDSYDYNETGIWVDYYDITYPDAPIAGGPSNGDLVAWQFSCTAYNGNTVYDSATTIWPNGPNYDYTPLQKLAGATTSYSVTIDNMATLQTL